MNRALLSIGSAGLVLLLSGLVSVKAQVADAGDLVRLGSVKTSRIETPQYQLKRNLQSYPSATRERNWLEIALPYKTSPDWMDNLTVTFYVLIEPKDDPAVKQRVLTGTVEYVNIKKGVHRSVMYMHPTTLERFGEPKRCAAVVSTTVNGRPVEVATEDMTPWKRIAQEATLILNRMDTPFAMANFDDFEAQKLPRGAK